jgi:hypothetical protein
MNGKWQQQKKLGEMTETEEGTEEYNNRIIIIQVSSVAEQEEAVIKLPYFIEKKSTSLKKCENI